MRGEGGSARGVRRAGGSARAASARKGLARPLAERKGSARRQGGQRIACVPACTVEMGGQRSKAIHLFIYFYVSIVCGKSKNKKPFVQYNMSTLLYMSNG